LHREGEAVLLRWDVPARDVFFSQTLPQDAAFAAYRTAIRIAGADQATPVLADNPRVNVEVTRRNQINVDLMYSGRGGKVRPIRCLEAWFFAYQNRRHSQLAKPTEFLLSVLRKNGASGPRLRIYFGASNVEFPPKSVYGLKEAEADVKSGWEFWAHVHNHTLRQVGGRPAKLGVPAPSTNDVQLLRNVARRSGLRFVWVTNGFHTGVIASEQLGQFKGPPERRPSERMPREKDKN